MFTRRVHHTEHSTPNAHTMHTTRKTKVSYVTLTLDSRACRVCTLMRRFVRMLFFPKFSALVKSNIARRFRGEIARRKGEHYRESRKGWRRRSMRRKGVEYLGKRGEERKGERVRGGVPIVMHYNTK